MKRIALARSDPLATASGSVPNHISFARFADSQINPLSNLNVLVWGGPYVKNNENPIGVCVGGLV